MAIHRLRNSILIALLVIGMAACGGGTQLAGGGIGGTGISQGPITGFGSIFVNGVEFNTNNATIIKDGTSIGPLSTSDLKKYLKVGMVVTVNGDIANSISGIANTVSYAKELQGPITAITPPNALTVLGQSVIVDNLTKIEITGVASATITDLKLQDTVEVSGFPTANGTLRATYIEVKTPSADVELKGIVSAISGNVLTVGAQDVDISALTLAAAPIAGDYVEVKGILIGTTVEASSLEFKSLALDRANADKAELQGYVNSVTSATEFLVNGQVVQINSQTNFKGGTSGDIKPGQWLEVEGALINGGIIATNLTFEDNISLEGNVTAVSGNILTIENYTNISIEVNDTLTEGSTNPHAVGDHIIIRGRKLSTSCTTTTCLLATELESTTATGTMPVELQGPAEALDPVAQTVTVLGVPVNTTSIQSFDGNGITDVISFFKTVKIGDLLDITGTETAGSITWQAIELDN
jgi:hypothetical protein